MSASRVSPIAPIGLVVGGLLGMAGSFAPSASLRGLAWGIDGTALIVATALLALHHLRRSNDLAAAGFLVFVVAETLVVSTSAMEPMAGAPLFGAGVGLWAAALALVSGSKLMPAWLRGVGFVAAILFAVVALQIYSGAELTSLSKPLPHFAYPFFAATLFGWAWVHFRGGA